MATLAERLGRGTRLAALALAELRARMMVETYRTGRSSWITIVKPDPEERAVVRRASKAFASPKIAHRSRLLLRILSSTPISTISESLRWCHREIADEVREHVTRDRAITAEKRWYMRRFQQYGLSEEQAEFISLRHTVDELKVAFSRAMGVRIRGAKHWLRWFCDVLERGWCSLAGVGKW